MSAITWPEAAVVGAMQGIAELFPVSSLGHSVLLPALVGGRWARDLSVSNAESPYLAFIVGLHVATAVALVVFFWRDWIRIVKGAISVLRYRRAETPDERLALLLVLATIPVGITGLLLEHTFRTVLSKPVPTALFLMLNGILLLGAEQLRRKSGGPDHLPEDERTSGVASDARIAKMPIARGVLIGAAQIAALAPGISRSGVTMAAGLLRGLSHEDAARFSFLLATPVIAAAGVLKIGDLTGPLGAGVRGQVIFGSLLSGVGAFLALKFLTRFFRSGNLRPFGIYCLIAASASLLTFGIR